MGCKICKANQVNDEPILYSNASLQENENKTHRTSLSDDQIRSSENNANFVDIEVVDPQAFNHSFIEQRQQAIDNPYFRTTIESWCPQSLEQLVDSIKTLSKDQSLIACQWIIFYWITCNIEYDTVSYFSKNYSNQSPASVLQSKKGVCAGYANIYQYLCDQLNISCEKINGYSKGYGFDDHEDALKEIDHVWNAIKIDHHWYLIFLCTSK
jgi:transglutaminase/protease-like cytokinesis protein 3